MLPAIYALTALTGCDSTSRIFGIGKKTALNICANKSLMMLGNKVESMEEITEDTTDVVGVNMAYRLDSA